MRRLSVLLLVTAVLCGAQLSAYAGKLTPIPSDAWHLLGDSMSMSGNTAAILALTEQRVYIRDFQPGIGWVTTKVMDSNGGSYVKMSGDHLAVRSSSGVRMYLRNSGGASNWGLIQLISIPEGSIALDGNRMLLGVSNTTRVYEFNTSTTTWAPAGTFSAWYPRALSGNTAVIARTDPFNTTGYVEMYERNAAGDWIQTGSVAAPEQHYRDDFGKAIAIEGDWMVIGAPGTYSYYNYGEAHVYYRNQGGPNAWGFVQTLPTLGSTLFFGTSVDISGNRIAVGMEEPGQSVHVYERVGSSYQIKGRFLPESAYSVSFGRVMCLSGDHLLASDLWRNVPNNYAGAVFAFDVKDAQPAAIAPEKSVFLSPPEATNVDFGRSVAMDDDTMVVGAPLADDRFYQCGGAYIYSRQSGGNWTLTKRLAAADADIQDYFGSAVALHRDTLAVAASGAGTIYIFERNAGGANQWGQTARLDGVATDLALDDDTLAAANGYGNETYVFERNAGGANQWGSTTINIYGKFVTLSGNTIIVSGGGSAANVYSRSGAGATDWHYVTAISTPYPFYYLEASSLVGDNVAIRGYDSQVGTRAPEIVMIRSRNQGGANQWGEIARITPSDRTSTIGFGTSVKMKGSSLVVGAPTDTTDGKKSGSIYVYEGSADRSTWRLARKIRQSDPGANAAFGFAVDSNGNDVAGGAPTHAGTWVGEGAVYVSPTQGHFAEWLAEKAPGVSGNPMTTDSNGDGASLFQEYAMGLSPVSFNGSPTPMSVAANGELSITYSLAKDAPGARTSLEWSRDLVTWKAAGDEVAIPSTMVSETRDAWIYRAVVPSTEQSKFFLRLRSIPQP